MTTNSNEPLKESAKTIPEIEQGRAIARGIREYETQKEKNKASAEKRRVSTLRNAADAVFNRNY